MTNLISGKEALIALANGEEVQIESNKQWVSVENCQVYQFLYKNCDYKFRLKPRTVVINGIEIPAPFEPKEGDAVFVLDNSNQLGFSTFTYNSGFYHVNFGAWRTEDEIKQVIKALRGVFNVK